MATRTVTGTIKHLDGTAWASGAVTFYLIEVFTTATETFLPESQEETTDSNGQFTITLGVPDSGTAHYQVGLPDERLYDFYLAAGATVDLVTLITLAGTPVAQDAVQTLLDSYTTFAITPVTTTYGMTGTEKYIRCTGTGGFTITLPAATGLKVAYAFKSACTGAVTIEGAGSDTIDGQLNRAIYQYENLTVLDAAAGVWDVVGG